MKVLLIGRRPDQRLGGGPLWGLQQVAEEVRVMAADPSRRLWPRLDHACRLAQGMDAVFLMKGTWLSPAFVGRLARLADVTYVLTDVTSKHTLDLGTLCSRVIVTGAEAAAAFRALGKPTVQLLQGYRPHVWSPLGPLPPVSRRLAFTGSLRKDREAALQALRREGIEVDDAVAHLEDAADLYRRSAAVLCPGAPGGVDSFSNRLVRVLASGSVPLHARCPSVERAFGSVVATYGSHRELVEGAEGLVSEPRGARAERVEAGLKAVEPYRWDRVAARWLEFAATGRLADPPAEARGAELP